MPPDAAKHIAAALDDVATVVRTRGVAQLIAEIGNGEQSAVIIDPRLVARQQREALIHTVRLAGAPLLAHTALTSSAMRALLAVADGGVRDVLVAGIDDHPAAIRRALERLAQETLGAQVVSRLAPALGVMPERLRAAVVATFVGPDPAETPHRLASRAGINRRSLDRWVARSGLASARLLVAAPKLVLAYDQLRRAELTVRAVAARVGYGSSRSLERQCAALIGMHPGALRDQLPPDAFATALARGLLSSHHPPAPDARPDARPDSSPEGSPPAATARADRP